MDPSLIVGTAESVEDSLSVVVAHNTIFETAVVGGPNVNFAQAVGYEREADGAAAHSTQEPDIADRTLIEIGIELIVIGAFGLTFRGDEETATSCSKVRLANSSDRIMRSSTMISKMILLSEKSSPSGEMTSKVMGVVIGRIENDRLALRVRQKVSYVFLSRGFSDWEKDAEIALPIDVIHGDGEEISHSDIAGGDKIPVQAQAGAVERKPAVDGPVGE